MVKYRLVEEYDHFTGITRYIVQEKSFLFWYDFSIKNTNKETQISLLQRLRIDASKEKDKASYRKVLDV